MAFGTLTVTPPSGLIGTPIYINDSNGQFSNPMIVKENSATGRDFLFVSALSESVTLAIVPLHYIGPDIYVENPGGDSGVIENGFTDTTPETDVAIPSEKKESFIFNISKFVIAGEYYQRGIDSGHNIRFVDENGNITFITRILLESSGLICVYGPCYNIRDAKVIKLSSGIVHNVGRVCGVNAALSDDSIGINVMV